ncbi:hypothetical protein Anas_07344 [Armadillidium nasatum]|uniref:Uncharacterized protein n=1 Tax=Armadillidium nasatum TaxID=96803 RepID=A0A5N5SS48_9CRUS|nr:hypothetical protein Anas_07344 [Armadillidium nasatum]
MPGSLLGFNTEELTGDAIKAAGVNLSEFFPDSKLRNQPPQQLTASSDLSNNKEIVRNVRAHEQTGISNPNIIREGRGSFIGSSIGTPGPSKVIGLSDPVLVKVSEPVRNDKFSPTVVKGIQVPLLQNIPSAQLPKTGKSFPRDNNEQSLNRITETIQNIPQQTLPQTKAEPLRNKPEVVSISPPRVINISEPKITLTNQSINRLRGDTQQQQTLSQTKDEVLRNKPEVVSISPPRVITISEPKITLTNQNFNRLRGNTQAIQQQTLSKTKSEILRNNPEVVSISPPRNPKITLTNQSLNRLRGNTQNVQQQTLSKTKAEVLRNKPEVVSISPPRVINISEPKITSKNQITNERKSQNKQFPSGIRPVLRRPTQTQVSSAKTNKLTDQPSAKKIADLKLVPVSASKILVGNPQTSQKSNQGNKVKVSLNDSLLKNTQTSKSNSQNAVSLSQPKIVRVTNPKLIAVSRPKTLEEALQLTFPSDTSEVDIRGAQILTRPKQLVKTPDMSKLPLDNNANRQPTDTNSPSLSFPPFPTTTNTKKTKNPVKKGLKQSDSLTEDKEESRLKLKESEKKELQTEKEKRKTIPVNVQTGRVG